MSDSEEEEIKVIRFKHEGVDYLKDANDTLYDPKTSDVVGYWDPETKEANVINDLVVSDLEFSDEEGYETFGSDEESEDSDEEDKGMQRLRHIYGIIEQIRDNPSKEEIEEMFAESDNVSYIYKRP